MKVVQKGKKSYNIKNKIINKKMLRQNQSANTNLEAISGELCINSNNGNEFCSSLVCEPANVEESQIGNLYIAGEIRPPSNKCAYLVNSLASMIRKELYRNIKKEPMESFETSLAKTNAYLADIASDGNIDWIGKLNMACVLFSGGQLHISQTGNAKILLLRGGLLTPIIEDSSRQEAPFPSKTFSNIASGPLNRSDRILITTSGLFNALSLEEIKHAISRDSVDQAIEGLGELSELDSKIQDSSAIIIGISQPQLIRQTEMVSSRDGASIAETEKSIQKNLSTAPEKLSLKEILGNVPISFMYIENSGNLGKNAPKRNENEEIQNKSKRTTVKASVLLKKFLNLFIIFLQNFINLSLIAIKKSAKILKNLFLRLKNAYIERKNSKSPEISALSKKAILIKVKTQPEQEKLEKKNILPLFFFKSKKTKLAATALVLGIGIFGIIYTGKKKSANKNNNISASIDIVKINEYLHQAKQKKDDAETALIYKDSNKAKSLLIEAAGLAEKAAQIGANSNDTVQIRNSIQIQLDQINKIITVQNPFIITNIKDSSSGEFNANIILAEKNGKLAAIDFESRQIADIDLTEYKIEELKKIELLPQEKIINAAVIDNCLVLITNMPAILKIDLENAGNPDRILASNVNLSDTISAGSYNGNIYLLNSQGQISKISPTGQSSPWLKNNSEINSKLISMAIDGDIFALGENGTIFKLSGGKLKNAIALEPDITPKSSGKIFTSADSDKLFVLDPAAKRIIMLDKKGTVLSQYKSEKFNNLKSIYADAKTNSMYVLNGNVVYRVDM